MRVTLLHNPGAGDDGGPDRKALEALVREAGHEVIYQSAEDKTWPKVLDEETDVIAVAGGDGTVGRVAKKLIGRNVPLAPLPLGTANNISKTLGLTELTLKEIVQGWDLARRMTFDAGVAKGPWGSRYFIEAFGVGLFACTIPVADENPRMAKIDDADEKVRFALKLLRRRLAQCPPQALKLTLDGKDLSGDYVLFEAMNMEFVGPNLYLAPGITPADGLLDVVLVTTDEQHKLNETLKTWQEGDLEHPELPRMRASKVEIDWEGFQVHFDDEPWPDEGEKPPQLAHIELTVEREAVSFLARAPG